MVTARRRPEITGTLPLSVTVSDSEMISTMHLYSLPELDSHVPNVSLDPVGPQSRTLMASIRGINYASSNQTGDPSVAVYVDDIYQTRPTLGTLTRFDMERVEVIRGPQNSLFGRNALAGAINIHTRDPAHANTAYVHATTGSFGQREVRAAVNFVPVTDTFAIRLAGVRSISDGYYRSISNHGAALGGGDLSAGRIGIRWTSGNQEAILKYERLRDRGDPAPIRNASTPAALASVLEPAQPLGNIPGNPPNYYDWPTYWTDVNIPEGQRHYADVDNLTLNIRSQHGPHTVILTAGVQKSDDGVVADPAAGDRPYFNQYFVTDVSASSQEIRLISEVSETLQIHAGYWHGEDDTDYGNITSTSLAKLAGANRQIRVQQARQSHAVFVETEYQPLPDLSFTISGRQMWEKKRFAFDRQSRPIDLAPATFLDVAEYNRDEAEWSDFSPGVSADWRIHDRTLVYASWRRGYKSGGYNAQASGFETAGPYEPEAIESFEIGMRGDGLDGRLRFHLALFHNDITDLHRVVNRTINGNLSNLTYNAASAVTRGFEMEAELQLNDNWRLRASSGYLDVYYREFCANIGFPGGINAVPVAPACGDQAGAVDNRSLPLFNAPQWQHSAGVSGNWSLGGAGRLELRTELNYSASLYTNDIPWTLTRRGAMVLVDSSLRWASADGRYHLGLLVRNLLNDIDTLQAIRSGNTLTAWTPTRPRELALTFGIELGGL